MKKSVSEISGNNIFAIRLQNLMKENNTTQQQLSEAVGISRQAVSQYCDSSTIPNANKLLSIAKYFNVSTDYLLGLSTVKDINTKTELKEVCNYTGLSELSVISLHEVISDSSTNCTDVLPRIIDSIIKDSNLLSKIVEYRAEVLAFCDTVKGSIQDDEYLKTLLQMRYTSAKCGYYGAKEAFDTFLNQAIYSVNKLEEEYNKIISNLNNPQQLTVPGFVEGEPNGNDNEEE